MNQKKYRVGIIGATGMVGQRFALLLENHPLFEVRALAASVSSAGKTYAEAVSGRWKMACGIPEYVKNMKIHDAADIESVKDKVDFVFCAVDMKKEEIVALETAYAKAEIPVVSNNSAHRKFEDVPMVIPEVNPSHLSVIPFQMKRLGTKRGFVAVKPNCSVQSYVPLITPLLKYGPYEIAVCTYQAISGAGKNFETFPEIVDNVIPYIGGEEEKSEREPLKIWGTVENGRIVDNPSPVITAQCLRVPALDGHMAAIFMRFRNKPSQSDIFAAWDEYNRALSTEALPSSPERFITYFEDPARPQTKLDRDIYNGMGITAGRLREDHVYDYKLIGLSHNTVRGAAGGAVLIAELLCKKGYI